MAEPRSIYQWDHHFWDEIYKGSRDSNNNRSGEGSMTWCLDKSHEWRFEEWALWHSEDHNKYDLDIKIHSDRKLTKHIIVFKGNWKNDYPYGQGKFFLNNKLFFEGNLENGYIHGKAKFSICFITLQFGIYNNLIKVPGYSASCDEKEFNQRFENNDDLGTFEGEFKEGLADGFGELKLNSGLSYKGYWSKGYPHGSGTKTYSDGRIEIGEFGILNEKSMSLLPKDYIEEENGQLIFGSRRFANGDHEDVNKGTIIQKARKFIKDF